MSDIIIAAVARSGTTWLAENLRRAGAPVNRSCELTRVTEREPSASIRVKAYVTPPTTLSALNVPVIHLIRDPLRVVLSLMNYGKTENEAATIMATVNDAIEQVAIDEYRIEDVTPGMFLLQHAFQYDNPPDNSNDKGLHNLDIVDVVSSPFARGVIQNYRERYGYD